MFKNKNIVIAFLITLLLIPILTVKADSSVTVKSQDELKQALGNNEVTYITLANDIETTEKINITRPVVIDGANHTMKYVGTFGSEKSTDKKVWGGIYLLQVYKTSATIKNIKLTGGNAALLVNGGSVKLEGTIDVSGNGFGGIELGQGKGVTEQVKLTFSDDINLVNSSDSNDAPTLWVPSDSAAAIVEMNGVVKTIESGDELILDVIEELFGINNPNTGDFITIPLIVGMIGTIILLIKQRQLKRSF